MNLYKKSHRLTYHSLIGFTVIFDWIPNMCRIIVVLLKNSTNLLCCKHETSHGLREILRLIRQELKMKLKA